MCEAKCANQSMTAVPGTECTGCLCRSPCWNAEGDEACAQKEQQFFCEADPVYMYSECRKACYMCGSNGNALDGNKHLVYLCYNDV